MLPKPDLPYFLPTFYFDHVVEPTAKVTTVKPWRIRESSLYSARSGSSTIEGKDSDSSMSFGSGRQSEAGLMFKEPPSTSMISSGGTDEIEALGEDAPIDPQLITKMPAVSVP